MKKKNAKDKGQIVGFRKDRKSGKSYPIFAADAAKGGKISCSGSVKFKVVSPKNDKKAEDLAQKLNDEIEAYKTLEGQLEELHKAQEKASAEKRQNDSAKIAVLIEKAESDLGQRKQNIRELKVAEKA